VAAPNPKLRKIDDFPLRRVVTDPSRFQFKQGYGEGGAGLTLNAVRKWDPGLANRLTLYHDCESDTYYVVNGHQRLALARRHGVEVCAVQILESADYTVSEARAYGAIINIAEGHGTAMDAAIFMRETGTGADDLADRGVDLEQSLADEALALFNLTDALFRAVKLQTLAQHTAVIIGRELPDNQLAQVAILNSVREIRGIDPTVNIANPHRDMMIADAKLFELIRLAKAAAEVEQS